MFIKFNDVMEIVINLQSGKVELADDYEECASKKLIVLPHANFVNSFELQFACIHFTPS